MPRHKQTERIAYTMTKRVTIKDVAKHAGVSFKTVARVVNREPSVDESYRKRVERSLKALDYKVDIAARNLRARHRYNVGLIYEKPSIAVQSGVLLACQEQGFILQLLPCDPRAKKLAASVLETMDNARMAGAILTPPMSESRHLLATLAKAGKKFVCIASSTSGALAKYPHIFVDDFRAARFVTGHLVAMGHKRIAFLWGSRLHRSSQQRFRGFETAMSDSGLSVKKADVLAGEYTFESGRERSLRLLKRKQRPTAIIGCNDEIAAGALIAAREIGLEIPGQVSIAGFEDSPFSRCSWPQITTARQPTEEIAKRAAIELFTLIAGRKAADKEQVAEFVPELLVRDSTAIPERAQTADHLAVVIS